MCSEFMNEIEKHITVVVLGDFGRSPRMQYHTLSLSENNFQVDVVAYKGTEPLPEIQKKGNVHFHYLKDNPKFFSGFPRSIQYVLKTVWQSIFLFWTLMRVAKVDCILVQNPPSVPTLPVCWLVSWLRSCYFFIDFHNYGYTILSLAAGKDSLFVRLAKWCEMYFSRKAHKSICVTKAMKNDLEKNWKVVASVFYDSAPDIFRPVSLKVKHEFYMFMSQDHKHFQSKSLSLDTDANRFSRKIGEYCELLPNRPAMIVSSTSWTEDEDFSILLAALEAYDHAATCDNSEIPPLLVCITGKGPLKSYYEDLIKKKSLHNVEIITLWLKAEDYPTFLACADLGVCLHSSSSGLDLPMKVVDMFGCCLPVCALAYKCIDELVVENTNGSTFGTPEELCKHLKVLMSHFPRENSVLQVYRQNLLRGSRLKWRESWNLTVYPLLSELYAAKYLEDILQ